VGSREPPHASLGEPTGFREEIMAEDILQECRAWVELKRRCYTRLCPYVNNILAQKGVNPSQFAAMAVLKERGERTMGEVAKELGITMGAGTNVMDKLVEGSLVERRRSGTDRRVVKVTLTPQGTALVQGCCEGLAEFWSNVLGELTLEERRELFKIYHKIMDLTEHLSPSMARKPSTGL